MESNGMIGKRSSGVALAVLVTLLPPAPSLAEDAPIQPKIAAHFVEPDKAEIEISRTKSATNADGQPVQVACGKVTVRRDAKNWSSSGFAYVIDDDKLWLSWKSEWLKEPQNMGVVQVLRYCRER
jgi:hypothetical protein